MANSARTRPTLQDVATAAGVSPATVSRVVNGSPKVSDEVRALVEEAIASVGYAPNHAARTLVTKRTNSIALVVAEAGSRVFSDPFFSRVVRELSATLTPLHQQLILVFSSCPEEEERIANYLAQGHVDGVILLSLHGGTRLPRLLTGRGVPTVLLGRPPRGQRLPYVDADNRAGACAATRLLLEHGARTIATISGPLDMPAAADRQAGYADALGAAAAGLEAGLVEDGQFTEHGGATAMGRLLDRCPGVDGVFAASDLMALGALRTLERMGRRVPEDVAVVGFDDLPAAAHSVPPLTTVRQPLDEMASRVCSLLLEIIEDPAVHNGARIIVSTKLVRRESA